MNSANSLSGFPASPPCTAASSENRVDENLVAEKSPWSATLSRFGSSTQPLLVARARSHGTDHHHRLAAGYNNSGQLFAAVVDGRTIVTRSLTPMLDAARVLLSEGADPATRLAMRHAPTMAPCGPQSGGRPG
jgi:hypothetical protein